jgi:hypothetical protein
MKPEYNNERFFEYVERWEEDEWGSPEWRRFLISHLSDLEIDNEKLTQKLDAIMPVYEKQADYIKSLERQLELLQKTLDLIEKYNPRYVISKDGEVIK